MSIVTVGSGRAEIARTEPDTQILARRVFYAGCLFVPLLALRLASVTVADVVFAVSALIAAMSIRASRPLRRTLIVATFLVTLGGATATLRADLAVESFENVLRVIFIVAIWPALARVVLVERRHVAIAAGCFGAGTAISGLVAIIQTRSPDFLSYGGVQESGRLLGLAEHPTDQGGLLAIGLCFCVAGVLFGKRKIRVLAAVGVLTTGVGLVLAASVSSFIAAAVGVLVLAVKMRAQFRVVALFVVGAALAIRYGTAAQQTGLGLSPIERLSRTTSGNYNTASYRLQTDQYAWHRILDQPFLGVGLDGHSGLTVLGLSTHNLWLAAWFQGGILFLLGLVVFAVVAGRMAFTRSADRDPLRAALAAGFAAALVFSMTSPLLAQRYLWMPAILLLTLASIRREAGTRGSVEVPPEVTAVGGDRSHGDRRGQIGLT